MGTIQGAISTLYSDVGAAINSAFAAGFTTTTTVTITVNYKLANPTATISFSGGGSGSATVSGSIASNANGGFSYGCLLYTSKKHTKYVRNKQIGVKFAEETDNAKFRSSLIYHATVEEDRNKLWDNKQVWNGLIAQGHQIVTALDVIEAVLLGGEKDRIIDEINKMSGFNSENIEEVENNLEDVTKN